MKFFCAHPSQSTNLVVTYDGKERTEKLMNKCNFCKVKWFESEDAPKVLIMKTED